jgi:hypothetical protein
LTTASAAPASAANSQPARWLLATVVALFLVEVLLLVAGVNLRRGLNHDEHQFVASGVLLARQGLLPYRDFPYFHVPLLSVIYARSFRQPIICC